MQLWVPFIIIMSVFTNMCLVCFFPVYPEEFLPTYQSIKEGATVAKAHLVS